MFQLTNAQLVFLVSVVLYTIVAAVLDYRYRRIPNTLTVPMCLMGLVYQIAFYGWPGLQTALLGFLAGFGILFGLWMIGSAGGGDVKLMGGLSVWLGASLTLKVLFVSLIFVAAGTGILLLVSLCSKGLRKTKSSYIRTEMKKGKAETSAQRAKRRVMAFAMPVALATWCVLALFRNQW